MRRKRQEMKLKFSINSWTAWSASRGAKYSHSTSIYASEDIQQAETVNLSLIPAMKRRRMNAQCKMAISTALDCLNQSESQSPQCVFASQHGELGRSTKIIKSMIETGEISPTDFSMSVHNTALGLLSIQSANQQPGTSIAAGDDTFGLGFLEALLQLQANPEKPVLYVYFDEPLPEVLAQFDINNAESRCMALLMSADTSLPQFEFEMLPSDDSKNSVHLGSEGLNEFINYCSSSVERLELNTSSHLWCWNRL